LAQQLAGAVAHLRREGDLIKTPGVAETLDWARALHHLGAGALDIASASATSGRCVSTAATSTTSASPWTSCSPREHLRRRSPCRVRRGASARGPARDDGGNAYLHRRRRSPRLRQPA